MLFENVSRLCAERGITFCALEKATGIGNGAIGKWGKEGRSPRVETVQRIAKYFGVSVDELLSADQAGETGRG